MPTPSPFKKYLRHISLTWPFPIDTVTPHGLLMLRNCFLDFAVEHWFGCRATEPGFTGDIGAIEVSLIDWSIEMGAVLRLQNHIDSSPIQIDRQNTAIKLLILFCMQTSAIGIDTGSWKAPVDVFRYCNSSELTVCTCCRPRLIKEHTSYRYKYFMVIIIVSVHKHRPHWLVKEHFVYCYSLQIPRTAVKVRYHKMYSVQ